MRAELLAESEREWPPATTCRVLTAARESSSLSFSRSLCFCLSFSSSFMCQPLTGSRKPDSTMAAWRSDGTLVRDRRGTVQKASSGGWANHVYMCGSSAYVKRAALLYREKTEKNRTSIWPVQCLTLKAGVCIYL